ncbi:Uncharacterized protein PBTT_08708 [Plasmodiophora brassicae]
MGTVKLTNVIQSMTNQYGVQQGAVPSLGMDGRGKSNVVVHNRTPHNVLEIARAFIVSQLKQFGEALHYLQEEQAQVIYMPADQSPSSLWRQLLNDHDRVASQQLQEALALQVELAASFEPIITERRFIDLFAAEFGYVKFYKPKTDECKKCLVFRAQLDAMLNSNPAKAFLQAEFEAHRSAA